MGPLPSDELLQQIVLDPEREVPLHAQLRASLTRLIQHKFEDANRFFSEPQLVDPLRISQGTVRRALTDLAADGLLEKRPAKGTIVRKGRRAEGLQHVAVFLPDYFSPNITEVLTRLHLECQNRHIQLQPFFTHKGGTLHRAFKQLKFSPQEGAVVLLANPPMATAELHAVLLEKNYDCVTVDTLLLDSNQKFVGVDNRAGIELGMEHLISLGHRTIALLVNEPEASENIRIRMRTFASYRSPVAKLSTQCYHTGVNVWESSASSALNVMESIWNANPRPTAIFTVSDAGAMAAIQWLQKRGVRVPEEVSVLGFDGSELGRMIHPALTSIAHPFQAMTDAVISILDRKPTQETRVFLAPTLIKRDSTGPCPTPSA